MRALRFHRFGEPPVLEEVDCPSPGPGETLVRVAAACLAHVDRSVASGGFGVSPPLPYVPATDGAGWVVESDTHEPGSFVWLRGGGVGVQRDGLAADYAVVPDGAAHPAAEGSDPFLAACFFSPATSAATALFELGGLESGERVLVTGGAGAVGSLTVQLALAAGAGQVTATVRSAERAAAVPAGAEVVVGDVPDGFEADLLIDTIGGPHLPARLRRVRPGGRAVLVGYTAGTRVELDLPALMLHDVAVLPLNMIRRAPAAFELADGLLARLSRGELRLALTAYPLADADAAWARLVGGRVDGRLVLAVDDTLAAGLSGEAS